MRNFFQALQSAKTKAMNTTMTDLVIIEEVKANLRENSLEEDEALMPTDEKLREIIKSTRRRKSKCTDEKSLLSFMNKDSDRIFRPWETCD